MPRYKHKKIPPAEETPLPAYIHAFKNGLLQSAAGKLKPILVSCTLCPRSCGIDRTKGQLGYCRSGTQARVFSFLAHRGEEPPLSGSRGSGTIFFSGCNMRCLYCQNHSFSQTQEGREVSCAELARIMLSLQEKNCHNINLVTPGHVLPQILEALTLAVPQGLKLPLVYNTNAYERPEIIALLEGIVDVYLPDMRYGSDDAAQRFSDAPDYLRSNRAAVKEMHRQVGLARIDADGIIRTGLIIRHLVLPEDLSGTREVMRFIAEEISSQTYISLMSQYLPAHKAHLDPRLCRRISREEYRAAQKIMRETGLQNGWTQNGHGLERLAGMYIKPKQA